MHCALDARSPQEASAPSDVAAMVERVHTLRMSKGKSSPRHFLRQWRKFRGYTLEHVAERVGMTHQNLGKIERGKVPYNEPLLDALAEIYRADRGSLIMRDPNVKDALWSIYDQLAAPDRERLVQRVEEELKKTGTHG
jgi:transcriptional regulator with XRE-family HTH domain